MLQSLLKLAAGVGSEAYHRLLRSVGLLAAAGAVLLVALIFAALSFNAWLQLHLPAWQALAITAVVLAVLGAVLVTVARTRPKGQSSAGASPTPLAAASLEDLGKQMSTGQFLALTALVGFILGRRR